MHSQTKKQAADSQVGGLIFLLCTERDDNRSSLAPDPRQEGGTTARFAKRAGVPSGQAERRKMNASVSAAIGIAYAILLIGCGHKGTSRDALIGTWQGTLTTPAAAPVSFEKTLTLNDDGTGSETNSAGGLSTHHDIIYQVCSVTNHPALIVTPKPSQKPASTANFSDKAVPETYFYTVSGHLLVLRTSKDQRQALVFSLVRAE